MNLTIGNTRVSTWKNIKAQYVAAACGLALAATAVTGLGASQDTGPAVSVNQPASVSRSISAALEAPQLVFFIAGSEQQAMDHVAQLRMDLNPEANVAFAYGVAKTTGDEIRVRTLTNSIAAELASVGTTFQVVDLR